jgi:hypothetical protein
MPKSRYRRTLDFFNITLTNQNRKSFRLRAGTAILMVTYLVFEREDKFCSSSFNSRPATRKDNLVRASILLL